MANSKKINIGILGGSFDPAHKGHLIISKIAIKNKKLKKVYWIVTKKNPFKRKSFFSLKERLKSARGLVKNLKKIQVLYLDGKIKSSRSIDVISYILKKKKPKSLYFIVGSDILLELHKWKSWKKIVKLTKLIVFYRRGYDKRSKHTTVSKYLNKNKPIKISSTLLRKKIKITN